MKIVAFNDSFVVVHDIRMAILTKSDDAEYPHQLSVFFHKTTSEFYVKFKGEKEARQKYEEVLEAIKMCISRRE